MPDWNDLADAAGARNWILVTALTIGACVRLLKSDTKIPINLPPAWRPRAAMALGIVSSVLVKVQAGTSWKAALIAGALAGVTAILGHELVIDRLFGGNEIPVPGLMVNVAPSAPAPLLGRSDRPPPMPPLPLFLMVLALACASCGAAQHPARYAARGAAVVVLDADAVGTALCHDRTVALEKAEKLREALALAKGCADAHTAIIEGAEAVKAGVNAWDAGGEGKAVCSAVKAGEALRHLVALAIEAGAKVPEPIADALAATAALGGSCK